MRKILFFLLLSVFYGLQAQNYKFGKVSKEELKEKIYAYNDTVPAAFLYVSKEVRLEPDPERGLIARKQVHKRLKIYKKGGEKYAREKIELYTIFNQSESVSGIKGYTYKLSGGKVEKIPLDKKSIVKEKKSKYLREVRFEMPQVEPGDVVEWKYTVSSPRVGVDEIRLQDTIPIGKLHFSFAYPDEQLTMMPHIRGFVNFQLQPSYTDDNLKVFKIDKTNIPAYVPEPYSGNPDNYFAAIAFQVTALQAGLETIDLKLNWNEFTKKIFSVPELKKKMYQTDYFEQALDSVVKGLTDTDEKIRAIYDWTKQKIRWDKQKEEEGSFDIVKAFKEGKGNATEINLNFINFLSSIGVEAYPVLISTVENGVPLYPSLVAFDRMITAVKKGDNFILADASEKNAPFGVLPEKDLNFKGRLVRRDGSSEWVNLYPEKPAVRLTVVNATPAPADGKITGLATVQNNRQLALKKRNELDTVKNEKEWLERQYKEVRILKERISGKDKIYTDLKEMMQFETGNFITKRVMEKDTTEEILPVMAWPAFHNPFTREERLAPVIFHYPRTYTTVVRLKIPEGYTVEKLPQTFRTEMDPPFASYTYQVENNGGIITVKSILKLEEAVIPAQYYADFKRVMDAKDRKEAEKIILKKK